MNVRYNRLCFVGLLVILISAACSFKATLSPAEQMATNIAMGVSVAQSKTAEAPTPRPSGTPTKTPVLATPTATSQPLQPPVVVRLTACWFGPGPTYNTESSITQGQSVELLGVGSLPGWYIIRNPYFLQPCWIQAADLSIDPRMNLSQLPVMTPYPLRTPKP
ncbi:MAG TPA: hypothetical protein VLX61_06805 [Anaerolineales bacterium]|nr:hypothetical protein [Anaerolineales bacterium]